MKRLLLVVCLLAIVAVPMSGCQRVAEEATEKAVERATGVDIEKEGDKVTVTGEQGEQVSVTGEATELPEGFPDDVPVFEDAKIMSSASMTDGGKTTFIVTFETAAAVADVQKFYEDALAEKKWTITNKVSGSSEGKDTAMVTFKKADTAEGVVTIATDDAGKTSINLSVSK